MPLPLAQRLSGNGDRLTRVDVDLAPGTDVDRWVDEHRDALGPAVVVRDGASLGERFRAFLRLITRIAYGFRSTQQPHRPLPPRPRQPLPPPPQPDMTHGTGWRA